LLKFSVFLSIIKLLKTFYEHHPINERVIFVNVIILISSIFQNLLGGGELMTRSMIQPYFVLSAKKYYKVIMNNYGISHFYTFRRDVLESEDIIAVPDGCFDLLFTCNDVSPSAEICASVLHPKKVLSTPSSSYFGVRFYPGECIVDQNISIKEIIGNTVSLTDIFDTREVFEKIVTCNDFMAQVSIFLEFYTKQIAKSKSTANDLLKKHMITRIIESKGQLKVKELAYDIGYSERHINHRFVEYFGISPKVFSKIIRFQYVLNKLNEFNNCPNQRNLTLIAQEAGYYDQSHMYKDFSEFSNSSPGQYLDLLRQKDYYNRLVVIQPTIITTL